MGNLVYLIVAASIILLGVIVIALRSRTPRTIDSGIRDHQRHMGALSIEARRALIAPQRASAQQPSAGARPQRRSPRE
jgi:hypothetical protein